MSHLFSYCAFEFADVLLILLTSASLFILLLFCFASTLMNRALRRKLVPKPQYLMCSLLLGLLMNYAGDNDMAVTCEPI